jgi:ribosomal protein S12 methylthiotransferase accessory factor
MTKDTHLPSQYISRNLLLQAPNNRHGITLEPQRASVSFSDVQNIIHMGVPGSIESPWESAAGGIGTNEDDAKLAAIGEGIERYCATLKAVPLKSKSEAAKLKNLNADEWCLFSKEQRQNPLFPFNNIYSDECKTTNVYDFQNNTEVWIPHPFVALRDDYQTGVPTSSGLAAGPTAYIALLRAIQELIERDALMITWLHSVPAHSIKVPQHLEYEVSNLSGEIWVFDLTPSYSPFPVIAVAGGIPKRGKWRYSLGVACRNTWEEALEKAYFEWNQGVLFAGIYEKHVDTSTITDPFKLKSFDEHAIYYTLHPEQWHSLPMFAQSDTFYEISVRGKKMSTEQALRKVRHRLKKHNIRMYYRDLTTIDAEQLGISVVRAVSPDLAAIFAHQEWPLIGNLQNKLKSRYPWANEKLVFPNNMPHPLG